jgi:hypothetical protein
VAVFDLTVEPGPDLAAVCYELGIARSLGMPVMIVTDMERSLPFDVDVKPVTLRGAEKKDLENCANALDRIMVIGPQSSSDSSVEDTIAYAQQYYGSGRYGPQIKQALDLLDDAKGDAVLAQRRLNTLLGFLSSDATMILYPAWRPHYSKPGKPACFHVMPFSEPWSNRVSELARQACDEANISYVRGDLVSDPNIIRSIWEEICKATHVLVDLTGFNPNVALELGIAHTLGRKTLIMGQSRTVKRLFPLIAKTRFDTYDLKDGGQSALQIVLRFVKS